jgi:hypothetical protein
MEKPDPDAPRIARAALTRAAREQRLAEALRANLRRRKDQVRARRADEALAGERHDTDVQKIE